MNDDFKSLTDLNEKEQETVTSPSQEIDNITEEDLQIIKNLLNDGDKLVIKDDTLYKVVEKFKKFKTKNEKIVVDFKEGITFENQGDKIIIYKNGKALITLDKKISKELIANGFEGKAYVPVTGYKSIKSFEVTNSNIIKDRIKKSLLSGALILLAIPILLNSCNNDKKGKNEYVPTEPPAITSQTQVQEEPAIPEIEDEPTIPETELEMDNDDKTIIVPNNNEISSSQICSLIDHYFKDVGTICRSIEDQKISYEDDLVYLGIGKFDYETTNQIVNNGANFIERLNAFKQRIQNMSYVSQDELTNIMSEFNSYLKEYREFINLNLTYAGYHLSTTETRISNNKERKIDLEREKVLIEQLIIESTEKLNIVDLSTAKIEEITNAILDGRMIITDSGIVIIQDGEYINLETFLQNTDRSKLNV